MFKNDHVERIRASAQRLGLPWVPQADELNERLDSALRELPRDQDHLLRICLFEEVVAISTRLAQSDGNPVEGWLLSHRRAFPEVKCTADQTLYGSLQNLRVAKEDRIIIDPADNEIRESATCNLIFARGDELIIPQKKILLGITLRRLFPFLQKEFIIQEKIPTDDQISEFDEILLCGTGRGVAPLQSLAELGWSSQGDRIFRRLRAVYERMLASSDA